MCDAVAARGYRDVDLRAYFLMDIYCIIASVFVLQSLSLDSTGIFIISSYFI